MTRLLVTTEGADNRFFSYVLGWQPSEGWIVILEEVGKGESAKGGKCERVKTMDSGKMIRDNDVGGMCSVLHIDVLLDSRYYGRACLVDSHELEQRFGCLVELQTHLLEGRGTLWDQLAGLLGDAQEVSLEKTMPYGLFELLGSKEPLKAYTFVFEDQSWQSLLRIKKTSLEQQHIRHACELTEELWAWLCTQELLGKTELEVRGMLIAEAMRLGLEDEAFPTIVASGVHSATPHHQTRRTVIAPGPLLVDMGWKWQGYCSDFTRMAWVREDGIIEEMGKCEMLRGENVETGKCETKSTPDRQCDGSSNVVLGRISEIVKKGKCEKVYDEFCFVLSAVKQAHDVAIATACPGVSCRELDAIARDILREYGLEEYFTHSLGHGVGLDIHESPGMHGRSETKIECGMVITIEPGVYLPGKFGVRWENTVIVA